MVQHGSAWLSMAQHYSAWLSITQHSHTVLLLKKSASVSMVQHGSAPLSMVQHHSAWFSKVSARVQRGSGKSRIFGDSGFLRYLPANVLISALFLLKERHK